MTVPSSNNWVINHQKNEVTDDEELTVTSQAYYESEVNKGILAVAFFKGHTTDFVWIGPFVISPHDWPTGDGMATYRIDRNPPIIVTSDDLNTYISIIEQMKTGSVIRAEYYMWPYADQPIQMRFDLSGFAEAYNQLVSEIDSQW